MMRELDTVKAVIDELGGLEATAEVTGRGVTAVYNWLERGKFSARTFLKISEALHRKGAKAVLSVWAFDPIEAQH